MDTHTPPTTDWHTLYTGERRRSRLLGATTVAVSLLAVGKRAGYAPPPADVIDLRDGRT